VYKKRINEKGKIEKHKKRMVAKGFSLQPDIDYGKTFDLVARLDIVMTILAIVAQNKRQVYYIDVK
jgi:hypothetical protein